MQKKDAKSAEANCKSGGRIKAASDAIGVGNVAN
jgi:hypothetical protein